jgi:hypothetical protein
VPNCRSHLPSGTFFARPRSGFKIWVGSPGLTEGKARNRATGPSLRSDPATLSANRVLKPFLEKNQVPPGRRDLQTEQAPDA